MIDCSLFSMGFSLVFFVGSAIWDEFERSWNFLLLPLRVLEIVLFLGGELRIRASSLEEVSFWSGVEWSLVGRSFSLVVPLEAFGD